MGVYFPDTYDDNTTISIYAWNGWSGSVENITLGQLATLCANQGYDSYILVPATGNVNGYILVRPFNALVDDTCYIGHGTFLSYSGDNEYACVGTNVIPDGTESSFNIHTDLSRLVGAGTYNLPSVTIDNIHYEYGTSAAAVSNMDVILYIGLDYDNYYIDGQPLISYVWTAWDQIAGNGGQYRCSLTKIKDAKIGDPSTLQGGDISDFNRLSSQSSIWNLYHNIPLGVETKIAWSGPGWMTLTLTEIPESVPRYINFQFKFYTPQVSSITPIFVENRPVAVEGNAALKVIDMFLSFIYDNEQQAALFYPVDHNEYGDYLWGYVNSHTADEMLYLYLWLNQSSAGTPEDPYSGGTQDDGGDPGNPIPQSHIDVPSYNTSGGLTDGVVTLYRLTTAQLQDIAGWLWSSDFIDNLNKFMGSADECLLSLTALPVKPTNLSTKQFRAGNVGFVVSGTSDPYNVEYVEQRFFKLDMGDFVFTPFWDSYLDFAPYSSIEIYLPGVGVQKLDIDDIACPANIDGSLPAASGSTIHLDYIIDMVTGVLVAFISINGELRYQFPGKVGYTIPLTGENYTRMIQGYVTATAGLIGTVASGGAAAPFSASAASAGIINAMKPDIYRGGNFSGDASMLSSRKPYLIYRRPNKPELIGQENFTGFPSYKSGEVGDFSGYTEFLDVHVEGLSCTEEERDQILAILKGGVLL